MDEIDKKITEGFIKLHFLEYKIKEKLPIDFDACKEIEDQQSQLKALQSILKEYWNYIVDWGKLYNIKFVTNDFGFAKAYPETGEIIWNDNYNSEEIRFSDIEGKNIGSNLEFENDNERYKHEAYQELISQIYPVIKFKDELLRKIEFKQKFESNNQKNGFTCNLHPDTVKEIYIYMAEKNYLNGDLKDFKSIFSKVSIPVETPVKWLIKNKRGTNPDRGNQTALFVFLELILKKVSNQDLIKSKDLFIDEKGKFIKNKLLRPDKDKLKKYGFETQLKDILKKADQPKNQ